jgi:hypothetical protein
MGQYLTLKPDQIKPSQEFLKENTVRYIMRCIAEGRHDELPPMPFVRRAADEAGFIAIDGHNLIAVKDLQGEDVEVYLAESAEDGLDSVERPGVLERNQDLQDKFDSSLAEANRVAEAGIDSFSDLRSKYPELFKIN